MFLGSMSHQRWGRLLKEHEVSSQTDAKGVLRFDADRVAELSEQLGIGQPGDDPVHTALRVMRETIEALSAYARDVQQSEREYARLLREENASLREMRSKEQEAHLKALEARQEALDLTEDRKLNRIKTEAQAQRLNSVVEQVVAPAGKVLISQLSQSFGQSKKVLPELPQTTATGDWRERLKGAAL